MSAKAFGLRMLFNLSKAVGGYGSETIYNELVKDHQARIDTVTGLDDDLPGTLATQKQAVVRIWGEVQNKATGDQNFTTATEQFNVELIPALDTAMPGAEEHRLNRPRYQNEFVPLQGEINATLLDWPSDGAERADLDAANTEVTAAGGNREYTQAMEAFDRLGVPTLLSNAKPLKAKYVKDKVEYDKERTAAEQLLTDLKKHAQKAHVAVEIGEAETALDDAKDDADVAHMDDARIDVATAKTACEDGKDFADEFALYVPKRAAAQAIVKSLLGVSDDLDSTLKGLLVDITGADAKADPPTRNYADAKTDVDDIYTALRDLLKKQTVDQMRSRIATLKNKIKGKPVAAFVDDDVKKIDKGFTEGENHFKAEAWKKLLMANSGTSGLLKTAEKVAERRIAYDAEKVKANAAVNGLNAHQPVAGRVAAMELQVTQADALAARDQMQIEAGVAKLIKIAEDCAALVKTSDEAKLYVTARKAADTRFTNLGKNAAAANLTEPLATIKTQLEAAAKLAEPLNDKGEAVVSGKPEQDFPGARKVIEQVVKDLTAAETLAASLGEATASQAAAGSAANKGDVEAAVAELKRQVAAIAKPEADLVAEEIGHINASLEEALRLAATDVGTAKVPLQGAADILVAVKTGLAQHARILAEHKDINDKLQPLLTGTEPKPADIKGKTDVVVTALAEALKQDQDGEWEKALAEARKAASGLAAADDAAKLRKKFDKDKSDLETLRTALTDPLKGQVETTMNEATVLAGTFDFAAAEKRLGKAQAQVDSARVVELAASNPMHNDFEKLAKKMMLAEGGDKLLDDLVQSLGKSPNSVKAMTRLAKTRFGIDMATDAGSKNRSVKKLWEMLAKVPGDTVKNPSLKKVERRDPGDDGGFYSGDDNLVVMNGRPGQEDQGFGVNLKNARNQNQLPGDVGTDYLPSDDTAMDYFDFATLHEVGHAVDDRLRFMESRQGQAAFGGWQSYGANIKPIADEVGAMADYYTTPEQKQYVADLITGMDPAIPTPPSGQEVAWENKRKKVTDWYAIATGEKLWWSQPDTDAVTMPSGLVFQEAYKNNWVSYPAAERKKGITGYQFRAPGEWFAELYACYHAKRLKDPGHPAVAWLSKLTA